MALMVTSFRRVSRLIAAGAAIGLVALGVHPADASNDTLYAQQWSLQKANVPAAWSTTTGNGVRIGIVDSGVNRNHEDLKDRVVLSATCTDTGGDPGKCIVGTGQGNDVAGHGTHVAGIAAATMGNNAGVAGVAPGAGLVVARVFKDNGSNDPTANLDDVKAGIEWVVANDAKVVNLSLGVSSGGLLGGLVFGGSNEGSPLGAAVQAAWAAGAIPVIAAGNENGALFGADGSYGDLNAIVVGATIRDDSVAGYSNGLTSGTKWGIVAPGGDNNGVAADMILSSFQGGNCQAGATNCYGYLSGTSMAAPMVTGAAALLLSQGLSREQVVQTLLSTADKISCGSGCKGRLNVGNAVAANAGGGGGGGGGTTTPGATPTTRKRTTKTTSAAPAVTAAPTTEVTAAPETTVLEAPTTTEKPRRAIVLNSQSTKETGIPTATGAAGVVMLAVALATTGISLRRTRASGIS